MLKGSRTRRGLRVVPMIPLVLATVWTGATVLAGGAAAASVPKAAEKAARYGAGWIATQIEADGGYLSDFGEPDVPDTAYAVVGLHTAGVGKKAAAAAVAYLESHLDALQTDGSDDPGTLAYFILAAHAQGVNPEAFGGSAPQNDLVARLLATQRTSGSDAGLFGAQDPTYDGAFRQGLALTALKAAGIGKGTAAVKAGVAWLEAQQCSDGLWESYRSDVADPCPPADPDSFTGPDTNSTSLAVQGLAAYGDQPHRNATVSALHAVQSSDGGFPDIAAGGQPSDPDSTALVIQALVAAGQNPGGASWTVSGSTPYTALESYQLGCSAPAGDAGAFFYPGSSDPNVIATVQAVPAAEGAVLPVAKSALSKSVPTMSCP